jgi:hypothetical protein
MVMVKFGNIRSTITPVVILATAVSLLISFATTPAIAQPTTGTPPPPTGPGDGTTTAPPTGPTEADVTACYEPIYGTAGGDEEAADEGDGGEGDGGEGDGGEGDGGEGTT